MHWHGIKVCMEGQTNGRKKHVKREESKSDGPVIKVCMDGQADGRSKHVKQECKGSAMICRQNLLEAAA